MKKLIVVFSLLFISLSSFTMLHKFYVSVTQVEYDKDQESLQIISRIFIDDIEEILQYRYDETLVLTTPKQQAKVDQYLYQYLQKKLTILVNNEPVVFNFIGTEYDNDLILCYLEVEGVSSLENITISNRLLMELFDEQQNIIHIKKGKKRKSLILEKEKDTGVLKFSE